MSAASHITHNIVVMKIRLSTSGDLGVQHMIRCWTKWA